MLVDATIADLRQRRNVSPTLMQTAQNGSSWTLSIAGRWQELCSCAPCQQSSLRALLLKHLCIKEASTGIRTTVRCCQNAYANVLHRVSQVQEHGFIPSNISRGTAQILHQSQCTTTFHFQEVSSMIWSRSFRFLDMRSILHWSITRKKLQLEMLCLHSTPTTCGYD